MGEGLEEGGLERVGERGVSDESEGGVGGFQARHCKVLAQLSRCSDYQDFALRHCRLMISGWWTGGDDKTRFGLKSYYHIYMQSEKNVASKIQVYDFIFFLNK